MTEPGGTHAVAGAYGYSGKHIARCLLGEGRDVLTLTNPSHLKGSSHREQK